jgi:hypothetical protein
MIQITKQISDFYSIDYYRVDFFIFKENLYIGEITFCESSAFVKYTFKKGQKKFDPDKLLGSYW